jgi:alpha-ketoglutarate-dependent taurine dioxygenase
MCQLRCHSSIGSANLNGRPACIGRAGEGTVFYGRKEAIMAISVKQLHPLFVGEVSGVDLREAPDAATMSQIVAAADRHAVLVFHDQTFTDDQQIAFSRLLGPLETTIKAYRPGHKARLDLHVSDVSNLDEQSRVLAADDRRRMNGLGNRLWHTDSSFKRLPARASLLYARAIPATQRQFVYTHRWRVHDLVIWDNRCTMHRGTDFDDLRWKRDMQRATVCDAANSCEQAGIAIEAA